MKIEYFFFSFLLIGFCSCLSAGTHGSIKSYQYFIPKYSLEKAINKIIFTNKNIQRDTTKAYNDSTKYDYYNDGSDYMTISITSDKLVNTYIFKYGGDKKYWDSSKVSNIFICYAFDSNGHGGSEGDGGISWYKFGLKKKLINLFENDFVNKIDIELKQKHTVN